MSIKAENVKLIRTPRGYKWWKSLRGITKYELGNSKLIKFLTIRAALVITNAGFENLSELVKAKGIIFLTRILSLGGNNQHHLWLVLVWGAMELFEMSVSLIECDDHVCNSKTRNFIDCLRYCLSSCLSLKECLMIAVSAIQWIVWLVIYPFWYALSFSSNFAILFCFSLCKAHLILLSRRTAIKSIYIFPSIFIRETKSCLLNLNNKNSCIKLLLLILQVIIIITSQSTYYLSSVPLALSPNESITAFVYWVPYMAFLRIYLIEPALPCAKRQAQWKPFSFI